MPDREQERIRAELKDERLDSGGPFVSFLPLPSLMTYFYSGHLSRELEARFLDEHHGRLLLFATRRSGWERFTVRELIPLLPADSLIWWRHAPGVPPGVLATALSELGVLPAPKYGWKLPMLMRVGDNDIESVGLNEWLLPHKQGAPQKSAYSVEAIVNGVVSYWEKREKERRAFWEGDSRSWPISPYYRKTKVYKRVN